MVEDVVSFADVPDSSQFHKEIAWLASEGISTGWDVGGGVRQYRPLDSIARDAMAAFLYRKAGSPAFTPPNPSPFTDVAPGAAFYKEITWLASKGISTGWDVGGGKREYRPWNPIARDAMAAFLYRFDQSPPFTTPAQSPFVDVVAGGAFYREITWLASSGISTGWDVGGGARQYRPLSGIARDAMAAFLYRYSSDKVPADPAAPAAGTMTVAPDVEILDAAQLDTAQLSAGVLTLPWDKASEIRPNDVLVAGVTTGTPEGLLVRVVQVVRDPGGVTVVKTRPATLTEAVVSTSGLLELSGSPEWSTFTPEPDVTVTTPPAGAAPTSGIPQPEATVEGEVFSQSFSVKKTLKAELGTDQLHGGGSITVESTIKAAARAKMTFEAGFLQLKEASVVLTPSFTAQHSVSVSGSLEGKASAKLGVLKAIFVYPGAVPVVVTAEAEVALNLTATGEAEISFVTAQSISSDVGIKYRDGSFNLINTKPQTAGVQNDVKATASLTAALSLDFDATIKLYGVAGITFGAGPYVSAEIAVTTSNGNQTWSCPIEIGFASRLGAVAGIEVMGFKLGEWRDVNTLTWNLAEPNPCEGTPVQAPGTSTAPLAITTAELPTGTVGQAYSASLNGSGGTKPYTWTITSGSLPPGLRLEPSNGSITGTPTTAGVQPLVVALTDSHGSRTALSAPLTVAPAGLAGIKAVSASHSAAYALRNDGTVWAWGRNNAGQLGNGATTDSAAPVQVTGITDVESVATTSGGAVYAKRTDGTVWAWGNNAYGQLGNRTTTNSAVPVQVTGLSDVQTVTASEEESAFAIKADGTVWAWGANWGGQLGAGHYANQSSPAQIPELTGAKSITTGSGVYVAYAVMADGSVRAWGDNSSGKLGNGSTATTSPVPVQVVGLTDITSVKSSGGAAIALKLDGTVWAWGSNGWGELGNGSYGSYSSVPVRVNGLSDVASIEAKRSASIYALRKDGTTWAWGANLQGELGIGSTTPSPTPVQVTGLSQTLSIITNGYSSVHALQKDGTVWAWGWNGYGQLGNATTTDSWVPGRAQGISDVRQLMTTDGSAYALKADGSLLAWGNNEFGQLGIGTTTNATVPVLVGRQSG